MTAFVPTQLGVMLPSDINDLTANGIADGEFAKRVAGAWDGAKAVEDAIHDPFPSAQQVSLCLPNLGSGTVTIYTVPANYCFFGIGAWQNPTSAGIAFTQLHVTQNGTDYRIQPGATVNARSFSTGLSQGICLGSGDALKAITGGAGLVFTLRGWLVPTTHSLKPVFFPLSVGNNTVYTCPTGKVAYLWQWMGVSASNPSISPVNFSGGTRIIDFYVVPVSGSPAANNLVMSRSIANLSLSSIPVIHAKLTAGETLVVSTDGGTVDQACWFSMFEVDA